MSEKKYLLSIPLGDFLALKQSNEELSVKVKTLTAESPDSVSRLKYDNLMEEANDLAKKLQKCEEVVKSQEEAVVRSMGQYGKGYRQALEDIEAAGLAAVRQKLDEGDSVAHSSHPGL